MRLGVNVSQQEGTLESLGKLYDLQYGRAAVTEMTNGKATATVNSMSRKVAIWAISFKDKDANALFTKYRLCGNSWCKANRSA